MGKRRKMQEILDFVKIFEKISTAAKRKYDGNVKLLTKCNCHALLWPVLAGIK